MEYAPIIVVLALIAADILSGLISASATGSFKSSVMREGAFHKAGEILLMFFMVGLEYALPYVGVEIDVPLVSVTAGYLGIMEIGSIFENIAKLNPALSSFIEDIKNKISGGKNDGV